MTMTVVGSASGARVVLMISPYFSYAPGGGKLQMSSSIVVHTSMAVVGI